MSEFGQRLRQAREAAGLSQEATSQRTATDGQTPVHRITITRIESGQIVPGEDIMRRLAKAVGSELWKLLK